MKYEKCRSLGGLSSRLAHSTAITFERPGKAPAETTAAVPDAFAAESMASAASRYSNGSERSTYTGTALRIAAWIAVPLG